MGGLRFDLLQFVGEAYGTTVNKSACSKQAMYGFALCLNDLAWNCNEVGKGSPEPAVVMRHWKRFQVLWCER